MDAVGVGYVGYLALLLPAITASAPRLQSWWTPAAVVIVFGSGMAIGLAVLTGLGTSRIEALSVVLAGLPRPLTDRLAIGR